jgi:signal transduction histidine kinase/CheY-like chemotaxis protein
MRHDDLLITLAYFSIPIQILISLYYYPLLNATPIRFLALIVLFALFILLCGVGHLLRALGIHGDEFELLNGLTAAVSVMTALYLVPMIPNIMYTIKTALDDIILQEELNKNRKLMAFMGFLCHEIRNPLFAITSSIAFMKEGGSEKDRINYIYAIEQSANLMLRLVNDVLDISKLESGKVELERKNFNVLDLLNGISASIQSQVRHMRGAAVAFNAKISENVPAVIEADPARILQIVYNLLSNASKFTEQGNIDFTVDLVPYEEAFVDEPSAEEGGRRPSQDDEADYSARLLERNGSVSESEYRPEHHVLKIVVSDTGCGIAPDRIDDIFRPFNQSKVSDYRKHGGTGLGLSIIAQLVKVMTGRIQVDSKEDEGSTFTVYLPVCLPSALTTSSALDTDSILNDSIKNRRLPPMLTNENRIDRFDDSENSSVDSPPLSRPLMDDVDDFRHLQTDYKVLVVDDNTVNRKILGRMLSSFHLELEFATNGQEAVDILASRSGFGLVLMDLDMPVLDGISATRIIRKELRLTELPVIALTAYAVQTQAKEALDAGVTEFATKPILKEDLRQMCSRYLLKRTQEIV